jgi:hypothetical protein
LRVRTVNALLAIASVGATYLALETAFSVWGLRHVPLRLHADLPQNIRVFAQSSKSGVVPRDPVVLLGDSYAQGFGDWLLEADPDRNGAFHSAHIIHVLTGRDVVTLGQSGAGSVEGMVSIPAIAYARTKDAWYLRLPRPHLAVVYFFEGNDLNNNTRFLEHRVGSPEAADLAGAIDRALTPNPDQLAGAADAGGHFPLFRFGYRLAQRAYAERILGSGQASVPAATISPAPSDPPNIVAVAGQPVRLPGNLQSPALELNRAERERAVLVFERSLIALHRLFPATPVLVVYLPSPLSSYRLLAPEISIQTYMTGRPTRYPTQRVAEYSDAICALIRSATVDQQAGFLDLRPAIRAASARETVHGPRDFKHFNRQGMEALGQAVAARLDRPLAVEPCWEAAGR